MTEAAFEIGSFVRPKPGQVYSGDFIITARREAGALVALIDVAGHGHPAFATGQPTTERLKALAHQPHCDIVSLLVSAHELFQGTQGAAVGAAMVDNDRAVFAGVGNIRCLHIAVDSYCRARVTHLASRDGLVGVRLRTPNEQEFHLTQRDLLVLHSDGVGSSLGDWDVSEIYAGSPSSVARAIVNRYGRDSDDASCIVIRHRPSLNTGSGL